MRALLCLTFTLSKCTGYVLDAVIPGLSSFLPNESLSVPYLHIIQVYGMCTGCSYPQFVFFQTLMRDLLCLTFTLSKCTGYVLDALIPGLSSFLPNESPSVSYLRIIQVYGMCTGCSNPHFVFFQTLMRDLLCLTFTLSKCTGYVLDALIPRLSSFIP